MLVLGQTRALGTMLWRFWVRRGVVGRPGGGAVRAPGAVARALLVILFGTIGHAEGGLSRGNPRAVALLALGLFGYGWSVMASTAIVAVRGIVAPLDARFLDELPLREEARVVARALGQPQVFALAIAAVHAAALERAHPTRDAFFGALLASASMVAGLAAAHAVRALLSPLRVARLTLPLLVAGISAFLLIAEAPVIAQASWSGPIADPLWVLSRGLVAAGDGLAETLGLFAVLAASVVAMRWAERAGFDRVDVVPTKRYRHAALSNLTLARVDRVLAGREPGARFVWVGALYLSVCVAGVYAAGAGGADTTALVRGVLLIAAFLSFSTASTRAARMVERDLVARALLSPLPIVPGELLAGKMAPIRRRAVIVLAPLLVLPFASTQGERVDVAWHVAAVLASVWVAAGALASVAFLTSGAGGGPRVAMSTPLNLERLLVLVPMLGVAGAPTFFVAGMQLLALALLAFEAKRAAGECVRWLDDQEDFPRETSVWRALLVLSAFVAIASFSKRILGTFHFDTVTTASLAYLASAGALLVLTIQERGGLTAIPLWPTGRFYVTAVASVACGFGVGAVDVLYARLVARLGGEAPLPPEARASALAACAFVFAAPIAEEIFFRGWLLEAIGREHAARGGAFAVALTAFAFASIQSPVSFAPAFAFGLVAGALARRYGAVGPAIVAHLIVNAMVLFAR